MLEVATQFKCQVPWLQNQWEANHFLVKMVAELFCRLYTASPGLSMFLMNIYILKFWAKDLFSKFVTNFQFSLYFYLWQLSFGFCVLCSVQVMFMVTQIIIVFFFLCWTVLFSNTKTNFGPQIFTVLIFVIYSVNPRLNTYSLKVINYERSFTDRLSPGRFNVSKQN